MRVSRVGVLFFVLWLVFSLVLGVLAQDKESNAVSMVTSGQEAVMTVEVVGSAPYQTYRQANVDGEPQWFFYPSGLPATNGQELETLYDSYLLTQEAADILRKAGR